GGERPDPYTAQQAPPVQGLTLHALFSRTPAHSRLCPFCSVYGARRRTAYEYPMARRPFLVSRRKRMASSAARVVERPVSPTRIASAGAGSRVSPSPLASWPRSPPAV